MTLTMKPLWPLNTTLGVAEFTFEADAALTVSDLKESLSPQLGGLAPANIRLLCAGRVWADGATVRSYGVSDGSTVYLMKNHPFVTPVLVATVEATPTTAALQDQLLQPPPKATGCAKEIKESVFQSHWDAHSSEIL